MSVDRNTVPRDLAPPWCRDGRRGIHGCADRRPFAFPRWQPRGHPGRRRSNRCRCTSDTAALGHLPAVAGQPVPGHIGDGMHAIAERPQRLGSLPVERLHPGDRYRLVGVGAGGQREASADRFREHQHVAGGGARFAEDAVGVHDALHGEAVDPARGCGSCGLRQRPHPPRQPCGHLLRRSPRSPRGKCSGKAAMLTAITTWPPIANTSLQALAAAIAPKSPGSSTSGGKKSVVETIGDVGADLVDRCVIERRQPDQQRRVGRHREVGHEILQQRSAPLGGATAARRPFGELEPVEGGDVCERHGTRAYGAIDCVSLHRSRPRPSSAERDRIVAERVRRVAGGCRPQRLSLGLVRRPVGGNRRRRRARRGFRSAPTALRDAHRAIGSRTTPLRRRRSAHHKRRSIAPTTASGIRAAAAHHGRPAVTPSTPPRAHQRAAHRDARNARDRR